MVYYFLVAFLVGISQIDSKELNRNKFFSYFVMFIIMILMILVVLLMPYRIDMVRYLGVFEVISSLSLYEAVSSVRWEPGFATYQWVLSQISSSNSFFIVTTLITMLSIIVVALRKMVPVNAVPLVLFGFLSFFYFYNLFSNVIRQGFAVTLLLLLIAYLSKNSYKKAIGIFVLSLLFHLSVSVAGILFIVKRLNVSIKVLTYLFIISSLLMITGINQKLMINVVGLIGGGLGDSVVRYSSESAISLYGSVNRMDFLMFTTIWVVWGLWWLKRLLSSDKVYEWIIKAYLSFSTIYILFGFIAFSDRLAAYAWSLIPLVLFYPTIKMNSKSRVGWILICMLISIGLFVYFGAFSLYEPLKLFY